MMWKFLIFKKVQVHSNNKNWHSLAKHFKKFQKIFQISFWAEKYCSNIGNYKTRVEKKMLFRNQSHQRKFLSFFLKVREVDLGLFKTKVAICSFWNYIFQYQGPLWWCQDFFCKNVCIFFLAKIVPLLKAIVWELCERFLSSVFSFCKIKGYY